MSLDTRSGGYKANFLLYKQKTTLLIHFFFFLVTKEKSVFSLSSPTSRFLLGAGGAGARSASPLRVANLPLLTFSLLFSSTSRHTGSSVHSLNHYGMFFNPSVCYICAFSTRSQNMNTLSAAQSGIPTSRGRLGALSLSGRAGSGLECPQLPASVSIIIPGL